MYETILNLPNEGGTFSCPLPSYLSFGGPAEIAEIAEIWLRVAISEGEDFLHFFSFCGTNKIK